jgi:hypothetical protein
MKIRNFSKLQRGGWRITEWQVYDSEWGTESFLSQADYNKIQSVVSKIQDKMPTITAKSNVLIDKTSDVPRPKFKEFLADNGCKKVTLLSKANIVFVSRNTVKWFETLGLKTLKVVPKDEATKLYKSLNKTQRSNVELVLHSTSSNDQPWFDLEKKCSDETGYTFTGYRNTKQIEILEMLYSLYNTKATLVYDDVLNKSLNKDGLDLDEEIYETLESMLISKDNDTFNLGIEMLSNVNLEENNVFKIALLMNKVHTSTRRFNAMSQYQNKNFKSLLNYLQINKIKWNQGWEVFTMSMWNKFGHSEHAPFIKRSIVSHLNEKFKALTHGEHTEIVDVIFK